MIPNFNPNKWDREKIIEYVLNDEPLDDQQIAFLIYFDKLQNEKQKIIDFLKKELKENVDYIKKLDYDEVEYSDLIKNETLQEVLDFIEGGKDD